MELKPLRKKNRKELEDKQPARMVCTGGCDRELPYTSDYFPLSKLHKWGLSYTCLECQAAKSRARKVRRAAELEADATAATLRDAGVQAVQNTEVSDEDGFTYDVLFECALHHDVVLGQVRYFRSGMYSRTIGFMVQPDLGAVCPTCFEKLEQWKRHSGK